jgi:hypothetical protein
LKAPRARRNAILVERDGRVAAASSAIRAAGRAGAAAGQRPCSCQHLNEDCTFGAQDMRGQLRGDRTLAPRIVSASAINHSRT